MAIHMAVNKTPSSKNQDKIKPQGDRRLKYGLLAGIFGICLFAVGLVSNHFASQQSMTGFPGLDTTKFILTNHLGDPIKNTDLIGKPTAMYFGFTYCPDICPTTLSLLADLVDDIGAPEAYQIILLTVDPERDTPDVLKTYLSLFDANILGLTGSEAEIADVLKQFGIYRAPADDGLGNMTIDHTSSVFLYYANGKMKGTISPAEPYEFARQKLVDLRG